MNPTYTQNQEIQIDGTNRSITDVMPVKQGDSIIDFVYELDGRQEWQATEKEMESLTSGEINLKELERINDV